MNSKIKIAFILLVLTQGLHSFEEYIGRLWVSFPPATMLCSLISDDLETGFLVINIGLFIFGLGCWLFPVLREYTYARKIIWFWIIVETINGIGHPAWTIYQGGYTPGVATAPLLLIIAIYLMLNLRNK